MKKTNLPQKIKVKLIREDKGIIFAELPEYGIFTEADSFNELIINVNDLLWSFFDVKKGDRGSVWYLPKPTEPKNKVNLRMNSLFFNAFVRPNSKFCFA